MKNALGLYKGKHRMCRHGVPDRTSRCEKCRPSVTETYDQRGGVLVSFDVPAPSLGERGYGGRLEE